MEAACSSEMSAPLYQAIRRHIKQDLYYNSIIILVAGRDGPVGTATPLRAGRSGDRIPVGGEIFRTRSDRPCGLPSLLYNGYRVFAGVKGRGVVLTTHPRLSAEVMKGVGPYLYSPSGPQWSVIGRTFTLLQY